MAMKLDRTEQRIIGVLIEKEATVPDIYPMTENALVAGCNQKNNRDPLLDLQAFQVAGALMALQEKGFVARLDGSGRATKFRHKIVDRLALRPPELAVLAELLLRGPQSPGALKPRVARMGLVAEPPQIEAVLRAMSERPEPLVELLQLMPRERDRRWRHLLGDSAEALPAADAGAEGLPPAPLRPAPAGTGELASRVAALEQQVEALERQLASLRQELGGGNAAAQS